MAYLNLKTFELYNGSNIKDYLDEFIEIDELLAPIIVVLNQKGYHTDFSCSGHPFSDICEGTFGESFFGKNCTLSDEEKLKKVAGVIYGTVYCEKTDDPQFPYRVVFENDAHKLYISFSDAKISFDELPDGFEFKGGCLSCEYDAPDYYSLLQMRLDICKKLYDWANELPNRT